MAQAINQEPWPKLSAPAGARRHLSGEALHALPAPCELPDMHFAEVLATRRSGISGDVSEQQLATLLWHISRPRRGGMGRFGHPWEGRATPSAGGLHIISLLCIPTGDRPAGIYDHDAHGLRVSADPDRLRRENSANVALLCAASAGVTLQFVADAERLASCYENSESLLWRDSGALAATICLVATALGLTSVMLGRTGEALLTALTLPAGFVGAGAVHLGAPET